MEYDPIKRPLGNFFNKTPWLRKLFFKLLDLLLLRTWHVHRELKEWLKHAPDCPSVLDAGAGFGQYTYYLSGKSPTANVLAVDVKEEQVTDCNDFFKKIGRKNVRFEVQDLVTFSRPDSFDLVISVDVMEHILEDVEVFKNFYTSMKPGAMLLISTPSDQGGSDVHEDAEDSFIGEHVRDGYNMDEIKEKLKSAGFENIETRYAYGKPGQVSWRLSMKYPMQLLNLSKLFLLLLPVYYLFTFPIAMVLNAKDVKRKHSSGTGLIVKAWK